MQILQTILGQLFVPWDNFLSAIYNIVNAIMLIWATDIWQTEE